MIDTSKSNSIEQREAEEILFNMVEKMLTMKLEKNPKIYIGDTYIQPDFYSEEKRIVGEIFAHVGKSKAGQHNKIAKDILKMLLLDKEKGYEYRKIIVVCDSEMAKKLDGKSYLAESIRRFGIQVIPLELHTDMKNKIISAQKREKMVNTSD